MYFLSSHYHFPFISKIYNIIGIHRDGVALNRTDKDNSRERNPETSTVDIGFKFVKRYFTQTTYLRGSNSY